MMMKRKIRIPAQLLLLLALIVLPALFFTGYELTRLGEEEERVAALYARQLDAILFSVNQHAWDVCERWMDELERVRMSSRIDRPEGNTRALRFGVVLDSQGGVLQHIIRPDSSARGTLPPPLRARIRDSIRAHGPALARLSRLRREGYRKIVAIPLPRDIAPSLLLLVTAVAPMERAPGTAGTERTHASLQALALDAEDFIRDILGPKFRDIAGAEDFILVCTDRATGRVILSTEPDSSQWTMPEQQRPLWMFPDHRVGIRMRGESAAELARARTTASIVLFSAVGLLLLAGAWLLFRGFQRELRLAAMRSDFVSNVSHELKTPLALIRMYAETLEMERIPDPEAQREYLRVIMRESDRLSRLINNILAFSRIESGRAHYHRERLDLGATVRAVLAIYRVHLEHEGFRLTVEEADALPMIDADAEAVAEALLNLLDNAMKYSGESREIIVRTGTSDTETTDRDVWVDVEDHGIGIPPDQQKLIFEKFYRVSAGLVHTAKGSGLGLTLVDHIMRAHGGRIDVRSTPGTGSCFRLCFTAAAPLPGD